jgi:hypothetical protein
MKTAALAFCLTVTGLSGADQVPGGSNVRSLPVAEAKVKHLDRFHESPCLLEWEITGKSETAFVITGQVFLASSQLLVPLKDRGFELKVNIPKDEVRLLVSHPLQLSEPTEERPLRHVVKWQACPAEKPAEKDFGAVKISSSPRGLLKQIGKVTVQNLPMLESMKKAFQTDGVETTSRDDSTLIEEVGTWVIGGVALSDLKSKNLVAGQVVIAVGSVSGDEWPEAIVSKIQGNGQLILLPSALAAKFNESPSLQQLLVSFISPRL